MFYILGVCKSNILLKFSRSYLYYLSISDVVGCLKEIRNTTILLNFSKNNLLSDVGNCFHFKKTDFLEFFSFLFIYIFFNKKKLYDILSGKNMLCYIANVSKI